uniref:CX domain-containing protein n=1 Tax=Caenorhabditis tropicalis TaxID=1561998 RepID=A0A1I7URQ8_9PELO
MEIALQGDSKGILYEGYTKAFKQCIFEEGDVEGKNERYEFRCDYDLECCGRTCCIPEPATIPLWLMILCIFAVILALLALAALLAWLLAKWLKSRPKKDENVNSSSAGNKYSALRNNGDLVDEYGYHEQKYSTPDDIYSAYGRKYETGSRNGGYRNGYGNGRNLDIERVAPDDGYRRREYAVTQNYLRRPSNNVYDSDNGSVVRHGVHETVEESFKQEITYERPVSTDSREML